MNLFIKKKNYICYNIMSDSQEPKKKTPKKKNSKKK